MLNSFLPDYIRPFIRLDESYSNWYGRLSVMQPMINVFRRLPGFDEFYLGGVSSDLEGARWSVHVRCECYAEAFWKSADTQEKAITMLAEIPQEDLHLLARARERRAHNSPESRRMRQEARAWAEIRRAHLETEPGLALTRYS